MRTIIRRIDRKKLQNKAAMQAIEKAGGILKAGGLVDRKSVV